MRNRFLKQREVTKLRSDSRSSLYNDINSGTFPPPVKLGIKSARWLEFEVEVALRGISAGLARDEMKALVSRLIEFRQEAFTPAAIEKLVDGLNED